MIQWIDRQLSLRCNGLPADSYSALRPYLLVLNLQTLHCIDAEWLHLGCLLVVVTHIEAYLPQI